METVHVNSTQENFTTSTSATGVGRVIANRIFVGNLPSSLTERDLMTLFNRYGKIRDVKIIPENVRNKSYGFVTFFSELDARRAIQSCLQHDCVMWGDRRLNVAPAIKRNANTTNGTTPTTQIGNYGVPRVNQCFSTHAVPMPVYSGSDTTRPSAQTEQQQFFPIVETNGLVPTLMYRFPHHQYPMAQCQYSPGTYAHYFVTPGYQPYIQHSVLPVNQVSHFPAASTCSGAQGTSDYRPSATVTASLNQANNNSIQSPSPNSANDNSDIHLEPVDEDGQVVASRHTTCTEAYGAQQPFVALAYPPVDLMKVLLSMAAPYRK